jgi:dolichol kinase
MLITLPLMLFIVMAELSIGAFAVLFLLDWRNMVKRNFLITYAIIYVLFTGLTVLLNFQIRNCLTLLHCSTFLDSISDAISTTVSGAYGSYTILLLMDKSRCGWEI